MLDLMGVILAELKIEEMRHSPNPQHENGARDRDQPGWALKQVGRVLQFVGTQMALAKGFRPFKLAKSMDEGEAKP